MTINIEQLLQLFSAVTVMNVHVYKIKDDYKYGTKPLSKDCFVDTQICLDTLKISNIKKNTPQKKYSVGLFNIPLIQTGQSVNIEIQDALGRADVLEYFFGFNKINNTYSIGTNTGSLLMLEGTTWIVDLNGNKHNIVITIPCFMPASAFNLNLQADGSAGVFDLNGDVFPVIWNNSDKLQYIIIGTEEQVPIWIEGNI